jgi:hypothetical protein
MAVGRCAGCAEEFCGNCLVNIQGQQYCGACKVMALGGKMPVAAAAANEAASIPCPAAKEAVMLAIVGFLCFGFVLGPIAIVKALTAKKLIAADPRLQGAGMATAGLVLGIFSTFWGVINLLYLVRNMGNH